MKFTLADFLATIALSAVMAFGAVSCIKAESEWQLEQDRIQLEQRHKKGLISDK